MYSGESVVFLEGAFYGAQTAIPEILPVSANEHLPTLLASNTMSLREALNIHRILREMVKKSASEPVPAHIAETVRDAAIRSVRDIDTCWSLSLVSAFHTVSKPLGLGMERAEFVRKMDEALMTRLSEDIHAHPLYYTQYRIAAVQESMRTIGAEFTPDHADRIAEWVYDRLFDTIRCESDNILDAMDHAERMIGRVDFGLRYNG